MPLEKGALVADKYIVEEVIGSGGVGVVVSARHTKTDERVAIRSSSSAPRWRAPRTSRVSLIVRGSRRFPDQERARLAASSTSGRSRVARQFMVLEHLDGNDLGAVLKERHHLPVEEAVDYIAQACEAVAEAHALGIIHRDLKPANLFLTKREDGSPVIKVLDFGISKILARGGSRPEMSMTQTASVMGSPLYMSPEQMVTPRDTNELTDVWSLGTILYEFLTGRSPFESATMPALCARICAGSPTPLGTQLPPGEVVPEPLEGAIMRCLERERGKRHNSAADLARRIAPFGTADAANCAERATHVSQQAGIPLSFDDDEEKTTVAQPLRSVPPPAMGALEPRHPAHDVLSNSEPSSSESRPVSFVPRQNRILGLGARARVLVGLAAVLFVGLCVGAAISASRSGAPAPIMGHAARTVARESELVSGSVFHRAAPTASAVVDAPVDTLPPAVTAEATASATAEASSTAATSATAADSAKPKTKRPPVPSPAGAASHHPKSGADGVLGER